MVEISNKGRWKKVLEVRLGCVWSDRVMLILQGLTSWNSEHKSVVSKSIDSETQTLKTPLLVLDSSLCYVIFGGLPKLYVLVFSSIKCRLL